MPRIRSLIGQIAGDRLPARIARLVVALLLAGSGTTRAQDVAAGATGNDGLSLQNVFDATGDGASTPFDPLGGEIFASTSAASIEQGQQALRTVADHVRRTGDGRGTVVAARMYSPDRAAAYLNSGNLAQAQEGIQLVQFASGGKSRLIRGKTVQETLTRSLERPDGRSRTLDGWADGYGQKGNFDGSGSAVSYGVSGTTFGAGYYLDDQTVVGILGGYSNSNVQGGGSEGDQAKIDATQVGLYARAGFGDHYLLGVAALGNQDYATGRTVTTGSTPTSTTAAYNADQAGILLEYGQNRQWGALVAQPLASIQCVNLQTDRFLEQEAGSGGAALSVDGRTDDSLRAALGARFLMPLVTVGERILVPEIHGRYMHELRGGADSLGAAVSGATGTPFPTPGVSAGESFYLYGTGATYAVTPHMSLYGHYIGQATRQLVSHTGTSGVQLTW